MLWEVCANSIYRQTGEIPARGSGDGGLHRVRKPLGFMVVRQVGNISDWFQQFHAQGQLHFDPRAPVMLSGLLVLCSFGGCWGPYNVEDPAHGIRLLCMGSSPLIYLPGPYLHFMIVTLSCGLHSQVLLCGLFTGSSNMVFIQVQVQ